VEVATEEDDEPGAGATGGVETAGDDATALSAATQPGVVRRHQSNAMITTTAILNKPMTQRWTPI